MSGSISCVLLELRKLSSPIVCCEISSWSSVVWGSGCLRVGPPLGPCAATHVAPLVVRHVRTASPRPFLDVCPEVLTAIDGPPCAVMIIQTACGLSCYARALGLAACVCRRTSRAYQSHLLHDACPADIIISIFDSNFRGWGLVDCRHPDMPSPSLLWQRMLRSSGLPRFQLGQGVLFHCWRLRGTYPLSWAAGSDHCRRWYEFQ